MLGKNYLQKKHNIQKRSSLKYLYWYVNYEYCKTEKIEKLFKLQKTNVFDVTAVVKRPGIPTQHIYIVTAVQKKIVF